MNLPYLSRAKDQVRTKEEPRMNLRTPNHQKVLFVKIALSFTSLIPCLIPPTDDRENTEKTPTQLPASKKVLFLRLLPKKVVCIPKKVDSFPEKVYSFPETVDLSVFKQKTPKKAIFLAHLEKKVYLCGQNCNNYDCIVTSLWQISRK